MGFLVADESSNSIAEPITRKTNLSVRKLCNNFKEFGFEEEAVMMHRFLKSVGKFSSTADDYHFSLDDLVAHFKKLKQDPFSQESVQSFVD